MLEEEEMVVVSEEEEEEATQASVTIGSRTSVSGAAPAGSRTMERVEEVVVTEGMTVEVEVEGMTVATIVEATIAEEGVATPTEVVAEATVTMVGIETVTGIGEETGRGIETTTAETVTDPGIVKRCASSFILNRCAAAQCDHDHVLCRVKRIEAECLLCNLIFHL